MVIKAKVEKKTKVDKDSPLSVVVYDMKGEKVEDWQLPESVFGKKENRPLVAQAIRVFLANQRAVGAETKTRAEVAGGGAKPWRQKGTGRARAGSIRSPLWRGGGVVHGPHNRDFGLNLPKKMKQAALLAAFSAKAKAKDVAVLNKLELKEPKTKLAAAVVEKLPLKSKTALIVSEKKDLKRAFNNLKNVALFDINGLNVYEVLVSDSLVFTKEAITELEKKFSNEKN